MLTLEQEEQERLDHMCSIERYNKMAAGRELKMLDLKCEVNDLCEQFGFVLRYEISQADEKLMVHERERQQTRRGALQAEVEAGDGVF